MVRAIAQDIGGPGLWVTFSIRGFTLIAPAVRKESDPDFILLYVNFLFLFSECLECMVCSTVARIQ